MIGTSIAYHLAARDADVIVIELSSMRAAQARGAELRLSNVTGLLCRGGDVVGVGVPVRQVRAAVEESADMPVFKTALMERAAFREIHITGMVPRQKDPCGGPANNVAALTAELLEYIGKLQAAAA